MQISYCYSSAGKDSKFISNDPPPFFELLKSHVESRQITFRKVIKNSKKFYKKLHRDVHMLNPNGLIGVTGSVSTRTGPAPHRGAPGGAVPGALFSKARCPVRCSVLNIVKPGAWCYQSRKSKHRSPESISVGLTPESESISLKTETTMV